MAVVSDYNPGDLLTGTAGEGGDGENAIQDLSINEELVKTLAAFADIQELEENWDEEGAAPLSPALINHTRELLLKQVFQPQSILPTSDGSIFMAWFKEEGGSMNMEFLPDGNIELYVKDTENPGLESFFPATEQNVTTFLKAFYENKNFLEM